MDAALTIRKPKNLSLAEAAAIGVGIEVSLENLLNPIITLTTSHIDCCFGNFQWL
jgi:hypothetical protein